MIVAALVLSVLVFVELDKLGHEEFESFKQTSPSLLTHTISFLKDGTMIDVTTMLPVTKGIVAFPNGEIWRVEKAVPVCLAGNNSKVVGTHPFIFLPLASLMVIGVVMLIPFGRKTAKISSIHQS